MKKIYKYPLAIPFGGSMTHVSLPAEHQVLKVDVVDGAVYLWAAVNPESPMENFYFEIYSTGQVLDTTGDHVGTLLLDSGKLVLHIFESTI